jgi:hypothetical protein
MSAELTAEIREDINAKMQKRYAKKREHINAQRQKKSAAKRACMKRR